MRILTLLLALPLLGGCALWDNYDRGHDRTVSIKGEQTTEGDRTTTSGEIVYSIHPRGGYAK